MTLQSSPYPPPTGVPPSIEQKAIAELEVDESYQRSTAAKESTTMIRRIAQSWDWRLCAPLTVARRPSNADAGPRFFVIDGQHRLEAARLRGDIPYLPCIISTFESVGDEARCFVAVNTARRAVTVLDKFRAKLAAGDTHSCEVAALIALAGLEIAPHSNFISWKPKMISCVGGVSAALSRWGRDLTLSALRDLGEAFPAEQLRYAGRLLQGLYLVRASGAVHIDDALLRRVLASHSQGGWNAAMLRRQARHGELPETAMQFAISDAYKLAAPRPD